MYLAINAGRTRDRGSMLKSRFRTSTRHWEARLWPQETSRSRRPRIWYMWKASTGGFSVDHTKWYAKIHEGNTMDTKIRKKWSRLIPSSLFYLYLPFFLISILDMYAEFLLTDAEASTTRSKSGGTSKRLETHEAHDRQIFADLILIVAVRPSRNRFPFARTLTFCDIYFNVDRSKEKGRERSAHCGKTKARRSRCACLKAEMRPDRLDLSSLIARDFRVRCEIGNRCYLDKRIRA